VLLYSVLTDSGAHIASHSIGTGVKRPGCGADHSPSYNAEVKNGGGMSHISSCHSD
jgi:hypothetical protein